MADAHIAPMQYHAVYSPKKTGYLKRPIKIGGTPERFPIIFLLALLPIADIRKKETAEVPGFQYGQGPVRLPMTQL